MSYREDDSVKSANTPGRDNYSQKVKDYAVYRCMIIKANYIDDEDNVTQDSINPEMTYEAMVIGGYREGAIFNNLRVSRKLGGYNNFSEKVLKASKITPEKADFSKADGDIVFVAFVAGDRDSGIILGGGNQSLDLDSTGAEKADGPRLRDQYNGIFTEIDKDGNYTLKRLGGKYNEKLGEFEPDAEGKRIIIDYTDNTITRSVNDETVKEVINGDDEVTTRTNKTGLKITEDGKNDAVTVQTKGGLKQFIDGKNDQVTTTMDGGLKQFIDGKNDQVTTTTDSGTEILIDGKNEKIVLTAADTRIEIDGKTGKITLYGDFVDLGNAISDFAVLYTKLAAAYNSHTHPYVDTLVAGAIPPTRQAVSSPPSSPLPANVKSNTVKLQS